MEERVEVKKSELELLCAALDVYSETLGELLNTNAFEQVTETLYDEVKNRLGLSESDMTRVLDRTLDLFDEMEFDK